MTIDDIAALCANARPTGDSRYMACCPAHEDHNPSLQIAEGETGAVLLKCFAGCTLESICEVLGLTLKDLFPRPASPSVGTDGIRPYTHQDGSITFPYRNAQGKVVFNVDKYTSSKGKETFRQWYTDEEGVQRWNMQGVRRELYRLPELLAAPPDTPIYFVEGEKDVETLRRIGLVATTISGGALQNDGRWFPHYNEALRERHIIILPDQDIPGQRHAFVVAQCLEGVAASVKIVDVPLEAKGSDISDWIATGATRDDLEALVRGEPHLVASQPTPPPLPHLVSRGMASVSAEPIEYLWWPYIEMGSITMLDGNPGVGKSLFTNALATHLSLGKPLPDQQGNMTIPCPLGDTLFFAIEDSLSQRVKHRLEALGADQSRIYYARGVGADEAKQDYELAPFTLQDMHYLRAYLEKHHETRLVVIDPIQQYLGAKLDMNRANETRPVLAQLAQLAEQFRIAIICCRHFSKASGEIEAMMRGLGSQDFNGAARNVLCMAKHPVHPHTHNVIHHAKSNGQKGRTQIVSKDGGVHEWHGVTRLDGEDIVGGARGPDPIEKLRAAFWLERTLEGGIPVPWSDLEMQYAMFLGEDASPRSLREGKKLLGEHLESKKRDGGWSVRLPPLRVTLQSKESKISNVSMETLSYCENTCDSLRDTLKREESKVSKYTKDTMSRSYISEGYGEVAFSRQRSAENDVVSVQSFHRGGEGVARASTITEHRFQEAQLSTNGAEDGPVSPENPSSPGVVFSPNSPSGAPPVADDDPFDEAAQAYLPQSASATDWMALRETPPECPSCRSAAHRVRDWRTQLWWCEACNGSLPPRL